MADPGATPTLAGRRRDPAYFRFLERDGVDWDAWWDVLSGRVAGTIFRGALAPDVCERTCRRFWASPLTVSPPQAVRSTDRVAGPILVSSGSLDAYLDASERARPGLDAIWEGPGPTLPDLLEDCRTHLAGLGVDLRPAEHEGRQAAVFKVRSRANSETFGLLPHDDAPYGWMKPHLAGFEVVRVRPVCNALTCLENGPGGELVYWNAAPGPEDRRALGLPPGSYGYPLEALEGVERITLEIRPGDVYVFDGGNVHAVAPSGRPDVRRTVALWSTGLLDERTVLQWA
ncbi:hypothetical protein PUR61_37005 [Streptomyces sp. BE20]|uniref:hypothetical protein n=1 Tax=Streptomyces sp. BE20 TaxID=3002525 RepID=UPI002E79D36F|nr:hypothetical protein [Streptomyces sp. BE20]MEE1827733.1 hypothetical protein [Streptomyces sp. BE20]